VFEEVFHVRVKGKQQQGGGGLFSSSAAANGGGAAAAAAELNTDRVVLTILDRGMGHQVVPCIFKSVCMYVCIHMSHSVL
jgi:hypothetical protein